MIFLTNLGIKCWVDHGNYITYFELLILNPHWLNNDEIFIPVFDYMISFNFYPKNYYKVNWKYRKNFDEIEFRKTISYNIHQIIIRFEKVV